MQLASLHAKISTCEQLPGPWGWLLMLEEIDTDPPQNKVLLGRF